MDTVSDELVALFLRIIEDDELTAFKKLAKAYGELTEQQLKKLIDDKDLLEICDADEKTI